MEKLVILANELFNKRSQSSEIKQAKVVCLLLTLANSTASWIYRFSSTFFSFIQQCMSTFVRATYVWYAFETIRWREKNQ